jgi:hypothetical protein
VLFQWKLVAVNGSILIFREMSEGEIMFGKTAFIRMTLQTMEEEGVMRGYRSKWIRHLISKGFRYSLRSI